MLLTACCWRQYSQLQHAFETAQADPECRCVVLTGSEEGRAFCSGDDVRKVMMAVGKEPKQPSQGAPHTHPTPPHFVTQRKYE